MKAKWEFAQRAGFDGIELRGDAGLLARQDELVAASREGVVFTSVCLISDRFIGDFDPARRRDAVAHMQALLSVAALVGARGAITPAAYGRFSRVLPPYVPPRGEDEDREVLLEGLAELATRAEREGVLVLLEPLNRYEDHMVNRLEQAVDLCRETGSPSVRVMADTFHMNIEERDVVAAIRSAGAYLAHVHLADSNRAQPGAGHIDFSTILAALGGLGFDGALALECRLSEPAEVVLPRVAAELRAYSVEAPGEPGIAASR